MEKKFKELYLAGEVDFEEIDSYIADWNDLDDAGSLREFLGLSVEEEDVWIEESDEALQNMLDVQK